MIRLDDSLRGDFDNGQGHLGDHDDGYLGDHDDGHLGDHNDGHLGDHDVSYLGDHDEGDLLGNGMANAVRSDKRINLGWSPLVTSTKVKGKKKQKINKMQRSSRLVNNYPNRTEVIRTSLSPVI